MSEKEILRLSKKLSTLKELNYLKIEYINGYIDAKLSEKKKRG